MLYSNIRGIIELEDGGVGICKIFNSRIAELMALMKEEKLTENEAHVLAIKESMCETDKRFRMCDVNDIDIDPLYRKAYDYSHTGKPCKLNIAKAREVHMTRIRKARDKKLPKLDIDYQRAMESKNEKKMEELAKVKQALRDLPDTFSLSRARTLDALKALIPDELKDVW